MKKKDARTLLKKYHSETSSEEEKIIVESWYDQLNDDLPAPGSEELRSIREETWGQIARPRGIGRKGSNRSQLVAALFALGVLSATSIFFINRNDDPKIAEQQPVAPAQLQDALPGGNRAMLSLSDGTVIPLDEVGNGKIAEIDGMNIRKTSDGQVVYESDSPTANGLSDGHTQLMFNEISTPKGGQFTISLPDGTKVWLNAASSLKYPVKFKGESREVELSGEAYFEVNARYTSQGDRIPFVVNTTRQRVEVLGTHFNINSYEDETTVSTTLLKGAVRVTKNNGAGDGLVLKPNQQSMLKGADLSVKEVNAEEMIAWKDGYFRFERADIQTMMRQMARWYDLEVEYEGEIPKGTFTGKVDRNLNLSAVLEILAFSEVNFEIKDKRLIIFP